VLGRGEQLGPGGELAGKRDDGPPDPILIQVVQAVDLDAGQGDQPARGGVQGVFGGGAHGQ
jgi:hypothetical protein